jgi:signal transduction histidine kinase
VSPGLRLGKWTLRTQLGTGASGQTWLASDDEGQVGALKLINGIPGEEARALKSVCHPAVVDLLDVGPDYLVLQLVSGQPLSRLLLEGPLPEADVLRVGATIADALASVHAAGMTHSDVKPANIVMGEHPVLVDFGAANSAGGSFLYASPERLVGQSGPEGDVYALGVTLRELLEGGLPMDELGVGVALDTPMSEGAPWLRELIGRMCATSAAVRPSAVEVADAFSLHGQALCVPDMALLRRRAERIRVPRPAADRRVAEWLREGGKLVLTGPVGSGRTRLLRHVLTELQAEGRPWAVLAPCEEPWVGVEAMLARHGLELPPPGPERPTAVVNRLVGAGGVRLLVDDVEQLDPHSRAVLDAAMSSPLDVLVTSGHALPGGDTFALRPLPPAAVDSLVRDLLGHTGHIDDLVDAISEAGGGQPGATVDLTIWAATRGGLVRLGGAWHTTRTSWDDLHEALADTPKAQLGHAATALGAALALYGLPMRMGFVERLTGPQMEMAVGELIAQGLAQRLGPALSLMPGARARLVPDDPVPSHEALLRAWPASRRPVDRYAWHALCAEDAERAASSAHAGVEAALVRDAVTAARLAEGLVELTELTELPGLRALQVRALAAAGRTEQARAIADMYDEDAEVALALAGHLIALEQWGQETDDLLARAAALDGPAAQLAELTSRTHYHAGRLDQAVESLRVLAEGAPPAGDDDLDRWLRARALWAEVVGAPRHHPEALDAVAGLAILESVPADAGLGRPARARLEGCRARLLFLAGRLREAIRAAELASDPKNGLPPLERARVMNNLAVFRYEQSDRRGALASWEQALVLFEQFAAATDIVRVLVNLCVGYREAGRFERALNAGTRAVDSAARLGLDDMAAVAIGNLGDVHVARNDLIAAQSCFANATGMATRLRMEGELVELARRQAVVAVRRHRPQALQLARVAADKALRAGVPVEQGVGLALQAVCWARRGDRARVEQLLTEALALVKDGDHVAAQADVRLWAGRAWLALGELDQAREHAEWTLFYAREVLQRQLQQEAEEVLAGAAAARSATADSGALQRLLSLSVVVEHATDLQSMLEAVADAALELLRVDRSFVVLRSSSGLSVVASASRAPGGSGQPSMSIVRRAVSQGGREVLALDLDHHGVLNSRSVEDLRLGSAMCVPLVHVGEVLGAIYVDSEARSRADMGNSAWLLRSLASTAASAVANIRRFEVSAKQQRQARELVHDIRGCLTTALLVAGELRSSPNLTPAERESIEALESSSDRIASMVEDYLRESTPTHEAVDLVQLSEDMIGALTPQARSQGVTLHLAADPATVLGVRHDLGRVLLNLIGNCLKYSPGGSVVRIALAVKGTEAVWLIEDEGPGLNTGQLVTLFDTGVQGTDALPGFGLGLGIVRRVVDEHGGTVEAHNAADGGARFEVRLPLKLR